MVQIYPYILPYITIICVFLVPCVRRVGEGAGDLVTEQEVDEFTLLSAAAISGEIISSADSSALEDSPSLALESLNLEGTSLHDDDIPDMESFNDDNNLVNPPDPAEYLEYDTNTNDYDEGEHGKETRKQKSNIMACRTYDLHITYDKYYQTPRLWLAGYDEHGDPLAPSLIFEDISREHAHKTVTIEPMPHAQMAMASIHPCRHAHVMKRITQYIEGQSADETAQVKIDQYLVIFLKFMSTVLPTIDYDYTMSLEA